MVKSREYDYAIIGAGAAGLHLVMAMIKDTYFSNKQVLVLDKDLKKTNDRTWCFWEKGTGEWDTLTSGIWNKGAFISSAGIKSLNIHPYRYKMVRGIDFYEHARKTITSAGNITWEVANVDSIKESDKAQLNAGDKSYTAGHVFDSRIDDKYYNDKGNAVGVLQHFKGWVIETSKDVFNPHVFVMMDFRVKWKNCTGFTYVLPTSERKALVEFTLFTPELIKETEYELMLKEYIRDVLKVDEFTVSESEYGVIPMTNYPFHKGNTSLITKIGTAGSWVKPSSGYSFKNAERFSHKIIENIKQGKVPSKGIASRRHRKYDTLFLEVLQNNNELGEEIFSSMYLKNPASKIFKFLDEETSLYEDFKIISSFRPEPFRKALRKHWREFV